MFASVAVDTGSTSSIESLTYEIPDGLAGRIGVGTCVLVPLASRQAVGFVIGLEEQTSVEKTRPIISELDSPVKLTSELLELAKWISSRYMCPLPRVVAAMLPGAMQFKVQACVTPMPGNDDISGLTPAESVILARIRAAGDSDSIEHLYSGSGDRSPVQRVVRQLEAKGFVRREYRVVAPVGKPRLLKGVRLADTTSARIMSLGDKQYAAFDVVRKAGRDMSLVELTQRHGVSRSSIATLEKNGIFEPVEILYRRTPSFFKVPDTRVDLMDEQQAAVDAVTSAIDSGAFDKYLLFGVTASGKTEVYLRCIEYALSRGKTSLVLLPEIALTTQVMNIFKTRFGEDVAVLHSALSNGERCDEWLRIVGGEAKVVLGARSAVFAPLENIGLVIVDEEHEGSYKQDTQPRYSGREAAEHRARRSNAVMVLGSATPSVETFYRAESGEIGLLTMTKRVENRPMPTVHIADLREQYSKGKVTIFSSILEEAIRDRLACGRQVMLLQNRRAYSTFLLCRDCGFVMRCPNCAVSLKFHSAEKKLSCHHCDYIEPAPDACPQCHGIRIGKFGIGTERVAEETKRIFPEARVLRMDRDTTARKGSHAAILDEFRRGDADILVGTQMIAKGLDFPNVTLVGVISADTSLNLPDFRASERTFQLISQVAGRSGRGVEPGEVVIQTFDPDNAAIRFAVDHDYVSFYKNELEHRQEVNYPPFSSLVNILSSNEDDAAARSVLDELVSEMRLLPMSMRKGVEIIGPNPAVLSKLRGEYRWHLVLRSTQRETMLTLLRESLDRRPAVRKVVSVDVDPMSML